MQKIRANHLTTPQAPAWFNRVYKHGDRPWNSLIIAMCILVLVLMLSIGGLLWTSSGEARAASGWSFILPVQNANWDPVRGQFDSWPFIYGTLITSAVAVLLAVPTGIGIAVFLAELCPEWLRMPLGLTVELLAAVPSVVYGLWGIFIFLPAFVSPVGTFLDASLGQVPVLGALFTGPFPVSGASRLAAGLILAIMIIPTIAAVSRDVLLAIPTSQREASLALGATRWETISRVLIPFGASGILGAIILGLGRAIGETMAVTMVIGNSIEGSLSLLRPGYTMSSVIANEFAEAVNQLHSEALIEVGFVLFVLTLVLNLIARLLVWRVSKKTQTGARS